MVNQQSGQRAANVYPRVTALLLITTGLAKLLASGLPMWE